MSRKVPLFSEWQRTSLIENMTESCLHRLVKGTEVQLDLYPLYAFAMLQKAIILLIL
jgi:hypothetical protein